VSSFRRSAYVVFPEHQDAVVAVVTPELGRGPLTVVVEAGPGKEFVPGTPVRLACGRLQVGGCTWELPQDAAWDPTLPRRLPEPATVRRCCDWLASVASPESLAPILPHLLLGRGPRLQAWQRRALEGAAAMVGGREALGWRILCGLGPGLTPSGDDFLCGWMLARYVAGLPRGTPRLEGTGRISRAYLRAAAAGQASEAWHHLVASLAAGGPWEPAAEAALRAGETSGADTLTGFLAGLHRLRT